MSTKNSTKTPCTKSYCYFSLYSSSDEINQCTRCTTNNYAMHPTYVTFPHNLWTLTNVATYMLWERRYNIPNVWDPLSCTIHTTPYVSIICSISLILCKPFPVDTWDTTFTCESKNPHLSERKVHNSWCIWELLKKVFFFFFLKPPFDLTLLQII